MEVILFNPVPDGRSVEFVRQVEARTHAHALEVCQSPSQLAASLDARGNQEVVLVLLAISRETLLDLHSLRDRLSESRSILVLPDREEETLAMGLRLYPRFVTNLDARPNVVGEVLSKMLGAADVQDAVPPEPSTAKHTRRRKDWRKRYDTGPGDSCEATASGA